MCWVLFATVLLQLLGAAWLTQTSPPPGLPFGHMKVGLQCMAVGVSLHPDHGWSTELIDLPLAETMKFFLPRVCTGNEQAMVCNTETKPHTHVFQSEGAPQLLPGSWLCWFLPLRLAKLTIIENYIEVRIWYEPFNLLFLHFLLEHWDTPVL